MSEDVASVEKDGPTRREPPAPDMNPKTVTGYSVETDLMGTTHITLTLRKGGTISLSELDPSQALLYLDLLRNSEGEILAVWLPETERLRWTDL